jgi:hypothetical protein
MKRKIQIVGVQLSLALVLVLAQLMLLQSGYAQDTTANAMPTPKPILKPVKNTFQSTWLIDNQSVMVSQKGTFEMDIQHRFGTVTKGYEDFWGFFAPSNIRLGVIYAPVKNLNVGLGITKSNMLWDLNAKYSILRQTKGLYPVSLTYYGNIAFDTRKDADGSIFKYQTQRISFFNQLIVARKINEKLSLQAAVSVAHQNSVNGYYTKNDSTGQEIFKEMKFNHYAFSLGGRYKLTEVTSFIFNIDQPITKHATNNPNPNVSLGLEFNTSNHSFQLFVGNYALLNPQRNSLYNTNSPFGFTAADGTKVPGGQFVIGFNITRLWNW